MQGGCSRCFFSVWQSRKTLKDITNIETYLYIAVRNKANRFLNLKNAYSSHLSLDEIPVQTSRNQDESPEDELLVKEMEGLLTGVINQLPEKCRLIFLMAREEGLKPKEIAEILSLKESSVRVQMKIAIEKIIANLKPYFPDITFTLFFISVF